MYVGLEEFTTQHNPHQVHTNIRAAKTSLDGSYKMEHFSVSTIKIYLFFYAGTASWIEDIIVRGIILIIMLKKPTIIPINYKSGLLNFI